MFKGHPKGLYVFLFANMGERFGYYTMIAIFTLFLQAKFGMSASEAGHVYGYFLFGIYFIPLIGGVLADKVLGFGRTISLGIILMIVGYILLANTSSGINGIYVALAVISVGTGFFKGNLQAMVGRLYDQANMGKLRDAAFSLFYMGINIGAFFAPSAAEAMNNHMMKSDGFSYSGKIPALANEFLNGATEKAGELTTLAHEHIINGSYQFTDLQAFCTDYIASVSRSYNYGFAIAAVSIFMSMIIFVSFRKYYKHVDVKVSKNAEKADENAVVIKDIPKEQAKKRLIALGLLFLVNIFFWMSFHQNGFTLTLFARDFTVTNVAPAVYTLFDLKSLLPIIAVIMGVIFVLDKKATSTKKMIGGALAVVGSAIAFFVIKGYTDLMPINPIKFQHFNPIFIVFITPIIIAIFTKLNKMKKEPSSPRKIGIGLVLASFSFLIMVIAALQFGNANDEISDVMRVTPFWLIGTYFSLTISELFYSPIGISFVSKVAPPKLAGIAQGGWFASTAIGNLLAGLIGAFWDGWDMWQFFLLLVVMLMLSAVFIFSIMRILENATEK